LGNGICGHRDAFSLPPQKGRKKIHYGLQVSSFHSRNETLASSLILKRASDSRPSGEWSDDDFDVLADGVVIGRIMKAAAAPVGQSWMWTLALGHHEDRTPTHGYEATREAAMAAFARRWRRE
jgi:hypothetical protein